MYVFFNTIYIVDPNCIKLINIHNKYVEIKKFFVLCKINIQMRTTVCLNKGLRGKGPCGIGTRIAFFLILFLRARW